MRLVDDHHVVVGQDPELLQRVDRQQRVVGHDDVHPPGRITGKLGEALGAERAPLRPEAFPGADRDLAPGPVLHPGHEVVAVPRGGVRGPLREPAHLPADGGDGGGIEQRLTGLLGRAGSQPVQTQVVAPALEDRVGRLAAEQRRQRRRQTRQVAFDQLPLQGDRGRRHDHR